MTNEADTTAPTSGLERRVRRLEDAHAAMDKQVALIGLEQGHIRELMDSRFGGLDTKLDAVSTKLDALGILVQNAATDPQGSVVNRELTADVATLKSTVERHTNIIQQGIGASHVFKAGITVVAGFGAIAGILNLLHTMGVLK